jgi:hypothetical protein
MSIDLFQKLINGGEQLTLATLTYNLGPWKRTIVGRDGLILQEYTSIKLAGIMSLKCPRKY